MAMGRRTEHGRTPEMWIATHTLPTSPGHPFYQQLNRALDAHGFDAFVEAQCAPFYAATVGRPSLVPGRYFRLLLIGYFEGLDSERGMAWRKHAFIRHNFRRLRPLSASPQLGGGHGLQAPVGLDMRAFPSRCMRAGRAPRLPRLAVDIAMIFIDRSAMKRSARAFSNLATSCENTPLFLFWAC